VTFKADIVPPFSRAAFGRGDVDSTAATLGRRPIGSLPPKPRCG
jgi:hypothetical protein